MAIAIVGCFEGFKVAGSAATSAGGPRHRVSRPSLRHPDHAALRHGPFLLNYDCASKRRCETGAGRNGARAETTGSAHSRLRRADFESLFTGEVLGGRRHSGTEIGLSGSIIGLKVRTQERFAFRPDLPRCAGRARKAVAGSDSRSVPERRAVQRPDRRGNIAIVLKRTRALRPAASTAWRAEDDMAVCPGCLPPKLPRNYPWHAHRRAGLARALALDPEIVFWRTDRRARSDRRRRFSPLIRELQQSLGLTGVMVTHDLNSLVAIADRIAVLVDRKSRRAAGRGC